MGEYTKNNFFYKPHLGARGEDEKNKFDAALDYTDAVLADLKNKNILNSNGQISLSFVQTPILVDGQDLMSRTFFVDAVNGSDSNPGTETAPFATIKKAIDSIPSGGDGEIIIVSDYVGNDGIINVKNKRVFISLHANLTVNWRTDYSISNYSAPSLLFTLNKCSSIRFLINSNNNGKIVINSNTTGLPVSPIRRGLVNFAYFFSSCTFNIYCRTDNYHPIEIHSGVLVNTDTWTNFTAVPPCIEVSGHYSGIGREIVVDTANGAGLVYLKDVSWFRYRYDGGLADTIGNVLTIGDVIKGGALSLNNSGYYKLPSGLIIQWGNVNNDGTGRVSVTFPLAFPNTCFGVVQLDTASSSFTHNTYLTSSPSVTGFTIEWRVDDSTLNTDTGITTYWIAIGY